MRSRNLRSAISRTLVVLLAVFAGSIARADRILVIGDSHSCGDFGQRLVRNLSDDGRSQVTMYCSPGLSVQHWVSGFHPKNPANRCKTFSSSDSAAVLCEGTGDTPTLSKVLTREDPDRVVVALGTNNLGLNSLGHFEKFATLVGSTKANCTWIGPPTLGTNAPICRKYGGNLTTLVDAIRKGVESTCDFIDSRPFTSAATTADCLHRYGAPAREWADGVTGPMRTSVPTSMDWEFNLDL